MGAITFRVHCLIDGTHIARAVVCAEAGRASVLTPGAEQLTRVHLAVTLWRDVEHEIAVGLNLGALPADGAAAKLLAEIETESRMVQYVTMTDLESASPFDVSTPLDAQLRGFAVER